MKQITESITAPSTNACGGVEDITRTRYEFEEADIGNQRAHYGGNGRQTVTFGRYDVGRTIEVLKDSKSLWTCWTFMDSKR
jgi:hypothetical protein